VCYGLAPNLSNESICRRTFSGAASAWEPGQLSDGLGLIPSILDGKAGSSGVFSIDWELAHQSSAINANYCPEQAAAVVILPASSSQR